MGEKTALFYRAGSSRAHVELIDPSQPPDVMFDRSGSAVVWQVERSAKSVATKERVWSRYVDVAHWRQWSMEGVGWPRLDGPFKVGTTGKSKPPGRLPAGSFRLDAVVEEEMFRSETQLPGARLRFEHIIQPADEVVTITHRAVLDGPAARLWLRILRKSIENGLPSSVERLATMAAADQ